MNKYNDLEMTILSCLILKPELMKEIKFEDKHIIKHKRLWEFMKSFYKKFGNFDPALMFNMCSDNWKLVMYIERLSELELFPNHFEEYQNRLIEAFEESEKEKFEIEHIYKMANELYCRNITVDEFELSFVEFRKRAKEFYEKENK